MDRGAWRATVHGVTKSWIRLKGLCTRASYVLQSRGRFELHAWSLGHFKLVKKRWSIKKRKKKMGFLIVFEK